MIFKRVKTALAINAILVGFLFSFSISHAAGKSCDLVHSQEIFSIENVGGQSAQLTRNVIIDFLAQNPDVPSFIKHTKAGNVPVILVNAETYPKLKPLLSQSNGYMFVQQVGYNNDHGLMRVGKNIIDADTPGARGYGEMYETGLAWKNLDSYLPRRKGKVYVMIETGYLLPAADYNVIEYYQRLRRGAVFRIPFTFGGNEARELPNTIMNSGENCFGFCKGATVSSNVHDITRSLKELGIADVSAMMQKPEVVGFLQSAMERVLKAKTDGMPDIKSIFQETVRWGMFHDHGSYKRLQSVIPAHLSSQNKEIFINWILALDATQKYLDFQQKYRVSSDGGYQDMNNGMTSFMLVYDTMDKANQFRNATYESPGVFYSWKNVDQAPLQ